jgi:hypothetical protein
MEDSIYNIGVMIHYYDHCNNGLMKCEMYVCMTNMIEKPL